MRLGLGILGLSLGLSSASAFAQETQTYTYDVHGRLTVVERTQGSTTRTTAYAIDDANNRTSRVTTSAASLVAGSQASALASTNESAPSGADSAEEDLPPASGPD